MSGGAHGNAVGYSSRRSGRRIALLTTGRQDWGILRAVWWALAQEPTVEVLVIAGGMHLSRRYGRTIELLADDAVPIAAELAWLSGDDVEDPPPVEQAAQALSQIGTALASLEPDCLVLAGDRFETAAAALAATILGIPIAHLHGGEESLGAFDDSLRHAITKLAHIHFAASPASAARLVALGESPGAIRVVGPPGVDNLWRSDLADRDELAAALGLRLIAPLVITTVHPATRGEQPGAEVRAVIEAMNAVPATYVITLPNADPGNAEIREQLVEAGQQPGRVAVNALGDRRYWGLMRLADAMLGNSSSGILEAPAIGLPVVNVGDRQAGRERSDNVIDVPADGVAVAAALRKAIGSDFRRTLEKMRNPLHDGKAGKRVAAALLAWDPPRPARKPPLPV